MTAALISQSSFRVKLFLRKFVIFSHVSGIFAVFRKFSIFQLFGLGENFSLLTPRFFEKFPDFSRLLKDV